MSAAIPLMLGGLLGAGGQVAGGILGAQGQVKPSDMINPSYSPYLDYALRAAQYDALNGIGFGSLSSIPNPIQQLVGQINGASIDNKTKRRALLALQNIASDPTLIDDPYGTGFSRDEIFEANKTGAPFGRVVTRGPEGMGSAKGGLAGAGIGLAAGGGPLGAVLGGILGSESENDTAPTGLPVKNIGRLNAALQAVGLNLDDVRAKIAEKADFDRQMQKMRDAGLGDIATQTVINRARASGDASKLLADAGSFATTGQRSDFQTNILDRIRRDISDQEEALMLRAQFGGFNPSAGMESLQRMRGDSELTALTQAIQAATALTTGLAQGNQMAQSAAGLGTNAALGGLGIASQQAMAANQIAAAGAQNRADSLANGVAGGLSGLGNALMLPSILGGYGAAPATGGLNQSTYLGGSGWQPTSVWTPPTFGQSIGQVRGY